MYKGSVVLQFVIISKPLMDRNSEMLLLKKLHRLCARHALRVHGGCYGLRAGQKVCFVLGRRLSEWAKQLRGQPPVGGTECKVGEDA